MTAARGGSAHPVLFDAMAETAEMAPILEAQHEAARQEAEARAANAFRRAQAEAAAAAR